jgi:hypothetical protein
MNNIGQSTSTQDMCGSPQCRATSTNFFFLFISLQASYIPRLMFKKTLSQLHKGHNIYTHLTISSFPKLGWGTKPYTVCAQSLLQSLALSYASLNIFKSCTKPMTSCTKMILVLLTSLRFLFMHLQKCLNMGKTHGPTFHTRYINPKSPKISQNG